MISTTLKRKDSQCIHASDTEFMVPENFTDPNTYCYRLIDGKMRLKGIILGQRSMIWPFDQRQLSCFREVEKTMPRGVKATKPTDEELREFAKDCGYINLAEKIKIKYHCTGSTARKWIKEAGINWPRKSQYKPTDNEDTGEIEQTQEPNPVELGGQTPGEGEQGPAETIIPPYGLGTPGCPPVVMPLEQELPKEETNPGYSEHHKIAEEIACLLDKKQQDYGFDNIRRFGATGCLIRLSDKVERLINLTWNQDKEPNFEGIEDTWKDIAGYAILALIEIRRQGVA